MQPQDAEDRLDRHALVISVWLAAGAVALVGFAQGFGAGGLPWLAGGFGALLAGYAGHTVVNAVLGTGFTPREVALGLVAGLAGLLATVLATLLVPGFAARFFLPVTAGMALLAAVVIFALVTRHGPRRAFALFDAARDSNPRAANRLPHRGGRT